MGRSLIGENIRHHAPFGKLRNNVSAVPHQTHRDVLFFTHCVLQNAHRFIERGDHKVAIAGLQALLDTFGVNVNSQEGRAGHGRGQWLRATHAAHATAHDELAREIAAKMFLACCRKSFERSLHNSLRANVNPGTCGHLPIHHQSGTFQLVELSQLDQCPTKLELAIRTRGAYSWVLKTPTGLPDCTNSVSSLSRSFSDAMMAW